ncbi:MAG: diguanylate cyclase [Gemmatimonadales bacterium]|nr:MAG: diguanylate cyclase [Gemmatimonadales bacterium]
MNICVPVTGDKGLESNVSAHFGSAPVFLIVDTESGAHRAISNRNLHHGHGMCQPLLSLGGEAVDGVVVGGIGRGALVKFQAANIRVYLSELPTVEATVAAFKTGSLREVMPADACGHHGHGSHDHGTGGQHGSGCGSGDPLR